MKPNRLHLITALLLCAGQAHAAPITQGAPGAVPPEQFRIMSDQEIAEHKAKMASLQGTAREEYRNAEYRKLKERAQAQGYLLPDTPPWGHTEIIPGTASSAPAAQSDETMQQLIAKQKNVVQQAMQAAEPVTKQAELSPQLSSQPPAVPVPTNTEVAPSRPTQPAAVATAPETAPPTPTATVAASTEPAAAESTETAQAMEGYRDQMRDRFDQFMQQRAEREQDRLSERQREKAQIEARRKAYEERVQARRQAYRNRQQQQRQHQAPQAMPQMPYQQGYYAPGYAPAYPQQYGYPWQPAYPPQR